MVLQSVAAICPLALSLTGRKPSHTLNRPRISYFGSKVNGHKAP